jgi:hypothetical protein
VPLVGDETFLSTVIDGGIEQTDELTALLDRRTKRYETTVNTEAQLIARVDRLTSILTLRNSSSDVDATDRNIILADELGELDGRGATLNSASGVDLSSNSASYLGDYRVVDSLHLQFGGEFETLEWATRDEPPLYSDSTRKDLWSPKAGIIFSPTREVTARVGYGETLGKGVRTDLISIEPTLIGGINQRYNDLVGTKSQNLGFGLDLHPRSSTFLGAEWNRRWLEEAATDAEYQYVQDYDLGEGYSTLAVGDSYYLPISQDLASAYAYEVLSRHWVIGTDYRYVRQDTNDPTAASRITHDHRSKAFTRYFFSGGLFLQGSATYRYQDRANVQIDSQGSGFGSDNAWFMGAGIGYRLPTRHGLILLDVQNIFGQDIALDQISYFNEPVFNDPTVQLAVNINF